ncbi:MAG: PrsW family intramembrane metalloprotease, partial [Anaerolineales bacterium]
MMNEDGQPSKFWAYVAVLVGGVLLLAGVATTVSFLGLPLFLGGDILGPQLGQIAGMFLGLVCGSLALFHGLGSILKRRSSSLRLPPIITFLLIFALVLGLGNLVINYEIATEFLFPPLFVLGAALPTFVVLAWAGRKLGWPLTWRQGALAFVAGSTLSIIVAILLQTIFPYVIYNLLMPFEYFAYSFSELATGTSGFLDKFFSSPLIIIFFIITALQAPIPEEFAKALGITMFGRKRVLDERQAFMIGLASGAGFAILENMLYEGVYAQWSGWTWGGVTLIRGIGSVMHPLCTAIVALGWFRARKMGWGTLLKAYFLAIGLHTLWNGG